jgi:ABC-2 type transport system permease protein
VIVLAGVLVLVVSSLDLGSIYGTTTYPVTYMVLELIRDVFALFMLIVTTFYAGEMVWREREARMAQMLDALPVPSWLPLAAKTLALVGLQGAAAGGDAVRDADPAVPRLRGAGARPVPVHLFGCCCPSTRWWRCWRSRCRCINHKYLGYFAMVLYYIASITLGTLGSTIRCCCTAQLPDVTYSAMNGFGHYLALQRALLVYWGGAALVLLAVALVLWPRGTRQLPRAPAAGAPAPEPGRAGAFGRARCCCRRRRRAVVQPGTRGRYKSAWTKDRLRADYELRYRRYAAWRSRASPTSTCRSTSCRPPAA